MIAPPLRTLMDLYFDKAPVTNVDELIRRPSGELRAPSRSTVPLLSLLKHDPERLLHPLDEFTLGNGEHELAVHLEYTVEPPKGKARLRIRISSCGHPTAALQLRRSGRNRDTKPASDG